MRAASLIAGALAGLLLALSALVFVPARPGDLDCRPVTLIDAVSGTTVRGAEDIALDHDAGGLIVSAYDRRGGEAGGLYAVPLGLLLDPTRALVEAARLLPAPGGPPLRPHGFALGPLTGDSQALALIERERRAAGGYAVAVQRYALSERGLAPAGLPLRAPGLCSANDLAFSPEGRLLLTLDREACSGLKRRVEDALNWRRGRVLSADGEPPREVARGIAFANGLAAPAGAIVVAATRAHRLLVYPAEGDAVPRAVHRLAAAPDNIAAGDDGRLYVAAHASLVRYAAFRAGLRRDSAGLVYRLDPAAPEAPPERVARLSGRGALAGVTTALMASGHLIVAAAYDAGLAVCPPRQGGRP